MRVSVVVPVYNAEKVLHYCIDSILNQTYQDFELILVDDGSTDNSASICDSYAEKDERVKVIHQPNGGVSKARNAGIEAAKDEFICFVDSDDALHPRFLSEMLKAAEDTNLEFVVCGYFVNRSGKTVDIRKYSENRIDIVQRSMVFSINKNTLLSAPWCKLYKTELIKKNNLRFPEDLTLGEDMVFVFSYINCMDEFCILNVPLYTYNIDNNNSLLRKYRANLLDDYLRMDNRLISIIDTWGMTDKEMAVFRDGVYYQYENVMDNTFSGNNTSALCQKLKYNKEVIKSKEFKRVVSQFSGKIHLSRKIAYKLNSYLPIYFYSKARRILKHD